jgi:hypothetical protein
LHLHWTWLAWIHPSIGFDIPSSSLRRKLPGSLGRGNNLL